MSASCLVIVESPNKIKTIQGHLNAISPNKYTVMASVGHICDLPPKDLGFDTKTFTPVYEVYEDKQEVVKRLKYAARSHESVLMATDDDREGEAIAYHLSRELGVKDPDRLAFGSLTREALSEAIKNVRKIDKLKVDSQETRRILDRMIGWKVSPVARQYVVPESSMGRVQSATLCLLVHLERTIKNFSVTNHYGVDLLMINTEVDPNMPWSATWDTSKWLNKDQKYWLDRTSAEAVKGIKTVRVVHVEDGVSESAPSAPFITSTLQRAAQVSLKFSPSTTMKLAQKLYAAGVITYMRTDNPNFAPEAFVAFKKYAEDNGLPVVDKIRKFDSKAGAQEAHEAIRPTSFSLKTVGEGDIQKLYDLIWMRAAASQLKSATYETKDVVLEQEVQVVLDGVSQLKTATFKARGRKLIYSGWKSLTSMDLSEVDDDEKEVEPNNIIPKGLKVGDEIQVGEGLLRDKKTSPPGRYSAASLIKKLEDSGIGRPSTYTSIIGTLEDREYIKYVKGKIHVSERGFKIIDTMEGKFKFIDVGYTSVMEEYLDEIASGKEWFPFLKSFWDEINQEVDDFVGFIRSTMPQHKCEVCQGLVIKRQTDRGAFWRCSECKATYADGNNKPGVRQVSEKTNFACTECDKPLVYRKGSYNGKDYEYFSCMGASNPTDKCYAKYELIEGSNPPTPDYEKYKEMNKYSCVVCDRKLIHGIAHKDDPAKKRAYWRCSGNTRDNPSCNAFYSDKDGVPDFEAFALDHKYKCEKCEGFISRLMKKDKSGYFWFCRNIPKGRKTECGEFYNDLDGQPDFEKYRRDHEHKCPNCGSFIALRKGASGEVWRCSKKNFECGWAFGSNPTAPDIEAAKLKYVHKCPNCKIGFLEQGTNAKGTYWRCVSNACNTFLQDSEGVPDLSSANKAKKK